VQRACLGPRRSGVLLPSHPRRPARDCGARGFGGSAPMIPSHGLPASWGERVFELAPHLLAPWGADGGGTGASAVRARVSPPRGAGSSRQAAQPAAGAVRRRRFTSRCTDRSAAGWAAWQYRDDQVGASHCAPAEGRRRQAGTPARGGWHAGPTGYQARRDTQPTAAVTARRHRRGGRVSGPASASHAGGGLLWAGRQRASGTRRARCSRPGARYRSAVRCSSAERRRAKADAPLGLPGAPGDSRPKKETTPWDK